jgi:hypothetical protein
MGAFRTMQEGVAAAYRLLLRNQQRYGKTIAGAFHGWAENPYFKQVARSMGLDPNEPFDMTTADPAKIERMMEEQFKREGRHGSHSVTREQIMGGIELGREALRPRGLAATGSGGGKNVTVNNSTSLTVQTPDPHTAGQKVHAELTRVHDFQTRHAQSRLV